MSVNLVGTVNPKSKISPLNAQGFPVYTTYPPENTSIVPIYFHGHAVPTIFFETPPANATIVGIAFGPATKLGNTGLHTIRVTRAGPSRILSGLLVSTPPGTRIQDKTGKTMGTCIMHDGAHTLVNLEI